MLTIDEIKDVKFRTNRGQSFYKAEDVDAFIDEVIETLEMKNNEKAELVHKMDILATRIEQYRSDEETVRNALLSAQKVADSTLKEANEQSEISLKNAKEKADKMIADAQKEVAKENGVGYIDFQGDFDEHLKYRYPAYISWDRVHPNWVGSMIIAKKILKEIGADPLY